MKNLIGLLPILFLLTNCSPTGRYASIAEQWEKEIDRFDSLNTVNIYRKNAILFAGSSSIRL